MKKYNKITIGPIIIVIIIVLLCSLYVFFTNKNEAVNTREKIQLERCIDGDTFEAKKAGNVSVKIRLSGVNTPEIAHPSLNIKEEFYGKEAKEYTCNRLKSAKQLEAEWDNTQGESHERKIAIVFIEGKNYNLELFEEGYANDRYLKNTMPYADKYRKALAEAKQNKKGMWAKQS